jgi:hypothetical protein
MDNVKVVGSIVVLFFFLSVYLTETWFEVAKNFFAYFLGGFVVMWTLTEYVFHRFLLHKEVKLDPEAEADGEYLASIFSAHLHHHVFMN